MIHNTNAARYIPPTLFHFVTATMTEVAGAVTDTIALNRAAANQTTVITIPILIPSNSVGLQGAKLASIDIDYEIFTAEPTSITPLVNLVTRGADLAVASVVAQTHTQSPAAAAAKTVDQHRLTLTITTPIWIDNDQYVLVKLSMVAGAGGNTTKFLSAVAKFTQRM